MKTSIEGMMEIASHEGIVLSPYKDSVGVWTIFVGHTAAAGSPNPAQLPKGVARPLHEALDTFQRDLTKYEAGVEKAFTRPLKQHQFDAAVSFAYNTGSIGKATWVKLFNAGDDEGAVAAIMNWKKPPEIIPRRKKEQALFRSGTYSSGGYANVYPASSAGRVLWGSGKRMDLTGIFIRPPPPDIPVPPPINDDWGMGAPPVPAPPDVPSTPKENPPMPAPEKDIGTMSTMTFVGTLIGIAIAVFGFLEFIGVLDVLPFLP